MNQTEKAELLAQLYWCAVRVTNEENHRGITKKTQKYEASLLKVVSQQFDLDLEEFKKMIYK
jgi:hypothetical protein